MIKKSRQYRKIDVNEDGLPVLNWTDDHNEDGLPLLKPVKKKETGLVTSPIPSNGTGEGGLVPLNVSPEQLKQHQEQTAKFERLGSGDVVTMEEDPLKVVIAPYKKEAAKRFDNYMKAVEKGRSESTGQKYLSKPEQRKVDQAQNLTNPADEMALGKLDKIQEQAATELFPNGQVAKQALQNYATNKGISLSELPENNETIQAAKKKAIEYDADEADIMATSSIADAAIRAERRRDPNFDSKVSQWEKEYFSNDYKKIIPEALYARTVDKFLAKGNAGLIAEQDPDLKSEYDRLANGGILLDNPTYGATIVANELSRVREEEGKNNFLGNLPAQKYMDDLAARLYKDDPVKKKIYDEIVSQDLPKYIDTPGFLDRAVAAVKHSFEGTRKSVRELAGASDNADELYDEEQAANTQVSADPKGFLHQLSSVSGDFGGLIAYMALGGRALESANISKGTAGLITTAHTFYGDEMAQARSIYPDDPTKQKIRAALSTAAFMALNPVLKGTKGLQKKFFDRLKPEIDDAVSQVESGAISKEAARDNLLGKFKDGMDYIKDAAKNNLTSVGEMTGFTLFKQGVDKVLGLNDQTYKQVHPDDELIDVAKMTAMGLAPVSLATASGGKKFAKESLYEIAGNPKRYHSVAEMTGIIDPEFGKTVEQRHENIEFLAETKNVLDEVGLPDNLQKSYLLHAMNEKILTKKAETINEPTLKKQITDQIKRSQEAKEKILKGENIDNLPQEVNTDNLKEHEKFLKEMFQGDEDGSYLKAPDQKLLGGKTFDKDKVPEFLETVAMQANNVMRGKDGEIVIDEKFDSRKAAEERWDKEIINAANEMYPEYKKMGDSQGEFVSAMKEEPVVEKSKVAVIKPEDNKAPEVIPLVKKEASEKAETTPIPEQAKTESKQPETSTEIVEPPTGAERVGEEGGGITHAANEVRRQDRALPEYQKTPESFEQWNNQAEKMVKEGYDVEKLMDKIEQGHDPTPVENSIRKIYIATLDAEIARNPTDALLSKQKRFIEIGDLANSRAGRNLVSLKGEGSPLSSISDFYVAKMEAAGVDKLTDQQKKETKEAFDNVQKADENATAAMEAYREEISKLKAENELLKQKKTTSSKPKAKTTHEDYVKERDSYREELRKAKEKHEQWLKDQGIQKSGFGITLTNDMVKAIAKIVKSHVDENVTKLEEVIKKVYEDIKDILPNVTEKDIRDVIAGEYNEKRPTRNQLAARMRDLKDEAYYINKLERLLAGTEPKSEKKKVKRNQQITDLQKKIKDFYKEERDAAKEPKEEVPSDLKKLQALKKRNETEADKLKERIAKGDFETKKKVPFLEDPEMQKKFPKQYKEALDAIVKREDARHEFDIALMKDQMAKRNLGKRAIDVTGDVLGTTKALVTGIDASGIGIQNLVAMVAHPRSALKALPESFSDFASAKNQERWLASVHNSELFPLAKKAGLDITEPQSLKASEKEEIFTHNLLDRRIKYKAKDGTEKTFVISKYTTKPFERIFTGLGNRMRWNLWARGVEKLYEEGYTWESHPKEFESLAKILNTETGRGTLHKQVERAFEFVSAGIWSPRLMASRMNILGLGDLGNFIAGGKKGYYGGLTPKMRAYALKDLAKFVTFGATMMGLAGLTFADDVDTDPNSATFGTFEVDGKRYNMWGGFTQYVRLIAKYIAGGEKQKGTFVESGQLPTTLRFLWSKTTPVAGTIIGLGNKDKRTGVSEDYMGKPITAESAIESLLVPLSIRGIAKGVEKEGAGSILWTGVPSFVGLNVSYENDFEKKSQSSSGGSRSERPTREREGRKTGRE